MIIAPRNAKKSHHTVVTTTGPCFTSAQSVKKETWVTTVTGELWLQNRGQTICCNLSYCECNSSKNGCTWYPDNIKGGDDTPLVRTTVSSKGGGAESQDTVEQFIAINKQTTPRGSFSVRSQCIGFYSFRDFVNIDNGWFPITMWSIQDPGFFFMVCFWQPQACVIGHLCLAEYLQKHCQCWLDWKQQFENNS